MAPQQLNCLLRHVIVLPYCWFACSDSHFFIFLTMLLHMQYVHFSVTTVVHLTPRPVAASVTLAGLAHNAPVSHYFSDL